VSPEVGTDLHRLAVAVERLAGDLNTGVATLRGDINVLATKESRNASDILDVEQRVTALEERRFPLPTIGGIMGVAGVVISLVSALGRG
jgi:hypothetical protein